MIQDLPGGWITIFTLVFGALTGALAKFFQYQQKQIDAADARTKVANDKVEQLQAQLLQDARDQRDALLKRADSDRGMAGALQDLNALVLKLASKVQVS